MATRDPQIATVSASPLVLSPAAAGDKIRGVKRARTMIVFNDSDASVTATFAPPGTTEYGAANPAKVLTCPANSYTHFTVLPSYRNPADGNLVAITWSVTTDISWGVAG